MKHTHAPTERLLRKARGIRTDSLPASVFRMYARLGNMIQMAQRYFPHREAGFRYALAVFKAHVARRRRDHALDLLDRDCVEILESRRQKWRGKSIDEIIKDADLRRQFAEECGRDRRNESARDLQ